MSSATMPPTIEQPQPPKSRTGCILLGVGGGCLFVLLACGGLMGMGFFGFLTAIKSSQPYTESWKRAEQNANVASAIGQPIEPGTMVQGNINLKNDDGTADLNYTISGPAGTATVHVVATKRDGNWKYALMDATTDDGTVIDLIGGDDEE